MVASVLRVYDPVTGRLSDVEVRDRMSVYVCGITPYDSAHLGHAFTYVHFDVLVRYLRYLGADVVHVQNVTDVDDDILRVARERRVDFRELAEWEIAMFERDMSAIGVGKPTRSPRATEFIPQIIEDVSKLVDAGVGYERGGWVYFRVRADPGYGRLSGLDREDMVKLADERGGHPEDPNRDDPLDFVLWQRSAPDEPSWESPWGPGRPGWHIECSVMSSRLCGLPIDVHGGGSDLVFPHHECELAQAGNLPGDRPFVRHWMHTGEVFQDGEKMSKSLGNMTFVSDLLERYPPASIRRFLLSHHYRREWEWKGEITEPGWAGFGVESRRDAFFAMLDHDLQAGLALRWLEEADAAGEDWVEDGREILGLNL
jgi:L-cysteine:1D-myo-inositol 2-amino-2-deoxy-alpha-D-glucopyranoside ligase